MPKEYHCTNLIGLDMCGETNPEQFSPGRYNKCRKCRNLAVKEHQVKLKEKSCREIMDDKINELKDGKKIQILVETIIMSRGLMDEGLTIPESFHYTQGKVKSIHDNILLLIRDLQTDKTKLENENNHLKKELEKLKKDNSKIKNFLEDKFNLIFEP
jgi:hypothetical protein